MSSLYVLTILTKLPGKRKPLENKYGVVAESKEGAKAKFLEQYPAQIVETDTVMIDKYEDGICRIA